MGLRRRRGLPDEFTSRQNAGSDAQAIEARYPAQDLRILIARLPNPAHNLPQNPRIAPKTRVACLLQEERRNRKKGQLIGRPAPPCRICVTELSLVWLNGSDNYKSNSEKKEKKT